MLWLLSQAGSLLCDWSSISVIPPHAVVVHNHIWQRGNAPEGIYGSCLPYWRVGKGHFPSLCELLLAALRGDWLDDVNLSDKTLGTVMVIVMIMVLTKLTMTMYLSTSALPTSWTTNHILSLVALSLELS